MKILKRIREFDFLLIISVTIMSLMGIISIYSSTGAQAAIRQGVFILLGFFIFFVFSFFDWRVLKENSSLVLMIYLVMVGLLIAVLWFGPEIRNVKRWFMLGPIMISPAEFAKLATMIILAKYFSMRHVELYKVKHVLLSGLYALIPAYLIFRQPDMGTAIIFVILWIGILIISGIRLKHFIALGVAGLTSLGLLWQFFMKDYQKDRIISFFNPQFDPQGIGWGATHAKIAIGNGGFWGQGIGQGTQTQYGFLPEPHTDFIFAAIAEEMGFISVLILILAISILVWRVLQIIFNTRSNFCRLFASGFLMVFIFQTFVNIGMNLGLLPIMGTPLPFITYGGSSVIFSFLGLAILESMRYNNS